MEGQGRGQDPDRTRGQDRANEVRGGQQGERQRGGQQGDRASGGKRQGGKPDETDEGTGTDTPETDPNPNG